MLQQEYIMPVIEVKLPYCANMYAIFTYEIPDFLLVKHASPTITHHPHNLYINQSSVITGVVWLVEGADGHGG